MGIIDKPGVNIDARFRSLLQKAVRRGNLELVYTTSALLGGLGPAEKSWYRNRSAVITFEECWPLGGQLRFNRRFHSKVAALVRVAGSVKAKDASGLGFLGYALHEGDRSVLRGEASDRPIKIIASAIARPDDFWEWIETDASGGDIRDIVDKAIQFKNAGLPRDRAVVQAAAYLAVSAEIPPIEPLRRFDMAFPYWVALDGHTPPGKRVLRDIARDLQVPLQQLEWSMFYYEGAVTNATIPSPWWQRCCEWRFQKAGVPAAEARLLWDPVRPHVIEALAGDSRQLHKEIYRWKMENRDRVEALKKQVQMYDEHIDGRQSDLF
jgi:hypothetical protein